MPKVERANCRLLRRERAPDGAKRIRGIATNRRKLRKEANRVKHLQFLIPFPEEFVRDPRSPVSSSRAAGPISRNRYGPLDVGLQALMLGLLVRLWIDDNI